MGTSKWFEFQGIIEDLSNGSSYCGIILPEHIAEKMPRQKSVRTEVRINNQSFDLAIQPLKGGFKYFAVSGPKRRQLKCRVGDPVSVKFRLVDPEQISIPEEFTEVLAQDDHARAIFEAFTTGLRRSLVHYVISAKSSDTRIRRSLQLAEKMKRGELQIQKSAKKDREDEA